MVAWFRRRRAPALLIMLVKLSAAKLPVCSPCAIAKGGDWVAKRPVEFSGASCMICGKAKPVAGADNWQWTAP
jgi:hypothetical protein